MVLTVSNRTVIQVKTHGQTMYRHINGPEGLDGLINHIESLGKGCNSPTILDLTCTESTISTSDNSHIDSKFSTPGSSSKVSTSPVSVEMSWNKSQIHLPSPAVHYQVHPTMVDRQPVRHMREDIRPSPFDITYEDRIAAGILVKMKNDRCNDI